MSNYMRSWQRYRVTKKKPFSISSLRIKMSSSARLRALASMAGDTRCDYPADRNQARI